VQQRLNGVFSMTADNQPLLGPLEDVKGLWAAEALWVTHAAGAARLLAEQMTGAGVCPAALRPGRFYGRADHVLQQDALRLYRDIYAIA
jgi:glycine/D-amino acid oxidase-like deaminating enzyme